MSVELLFGSHALLVQRHDIPRSWNNASMLSVTGSHAVAGEGHVNITWKVIVTCHWLMVAIRRHANAMSILRQGLVEGSCQQWVATQRRQDAMLTVARRQVVHSHQIYVVGYVL